jgi:hypothetical protein
MSSSVQLSWACQHRLHFEIYVDGRLRAHSGLMGMTDPPRLLVVEGLDSAKEIRLVTRAHDDQDRGGLVGGWGEPAFYK